MQGNYFISVQTPGADGGMQGGNGVQNYPREAYQLISIEQITQGKTKGLFELKLNMEYQSFFESIPEELDIKIVTIMGRTGQGKSTLANLFIHSMVDGCQSGENFFRVGHGSAKVTQGIYFYPQWLQRKGVTTEAIVLFDLEGIGSKMPEDWTEQQQKSYQKCLFQMHALAELFSSTVIYNTMDIRLTENHFYDIKNIDFENKVYRKNKRFICFRDSTRKKEEQFKIDMKVNKDFQSFLKLFDDYLFLPRPTDDETLNENYGGELQSRFGKQLISYYDRIFENSVLSHLNKEESSKMQGWEIAYKLNLYVSLLNISEQGLYLQIELFKLIQNFQKTIKTRMQQLFDQEYIKNKIYENYKEILSRESMRFCLVSLQYQMQTILLRDLDIQMQAKVEEIRILRQKFDEHMQEQQQIHNNAEGINANQTGEGNNNFNMKTGFQQQEEEVKLQNFQELIKNRDTRIELREANLLARMKNLEIKEVQANISGPRVVTGSQSIAEEHYAILREQKALQDEKAAFFRGGGYQRGVLTDMAFNTLYCVGGSVVGSTLANLIQGKAKNKKKLAKEMAMGTLVGTAFGITTSLAKNFGGGYAGVTLKTFFNLRSAHHIYRNKYFAESAKSSELKKVAANTAVTISSSLATLLFTGGLGIAISVSVLSGFATQVISNWLFSRKKDSMTAINMIVNKQTLDGFWPMDMELVLALKLKEDRIMSLKLIDHNKIFINQYLSYIQEKSQLKSRLPTFFYEEQNYTNNMKFTQLIMHIICYYAITDAELTSEQEKSLDLALKFLEEYPAMEMYTKEIFNASELFRKNFAENLQILYELQIKDEGDIQQMIREQQQQTTNGNKLLQQDNKFAGKVEGLSTNSTGPASQTSLNSLLQPTTAADKTTASGSSTGISGQVKQNSSQSQPQQPSQQLQQLNTQQQQQLQQQQVTSSPKNNSESLSTQNVQSLSGGGNKPASLNSIDISNIKIGSWVLNEKLCSKLHLDYDLFIDTVPPEILEQYEDNVEEAYNLWLTLICVQSVDNSFIFTICVQRAMDWLATQNFYLIDSLDTFSDLLKSMKYIYQQQ